MRFQSIPIRILAPFTCLVLAAGLPTLRAQTPTHATGEFSILSNEGDNCTETVSINSGSVSANYEMYESVSSFTSQLASAISSNQSLGVTATASGSSIFLTSVATGTAANVTFSASGCATESDGSLSGGSN